MRASLRPGQAPRRAAATCPRYYRNDWGETFVERGSSQIGSVGVKASGLRCPAVLTAMQAILVVGYHVPVAVSTLISPDNSWHANMVDNSFLNDHLCGEGTPRDCPPG